MANAKTERGQFSSRKKVEAVLRLLRGEDQYTQRELNAIAHRLNTRPRKCLDFATPLEAYAQLRLHSPVVLRT